MAARRTTTAPKRVVIAPPQSVATNPARYRVCPASPDVCTVNGYPVAVRIYKGPKAFFIHCGFCGSRIYLTPRWHPLAGLTAEQAVAQRCVITDTK